MTNSLTPVLRMPEYSNGVARGIVDVSEAYAEVNRTSGELVVLGDQCRSTNLGYIDAVVAFAAQVGSPVALIDAGEAVHAFFTQCARRHQVSLRVIR